MSECNRGIKSRRNCYPQWDNYPCWVREHMACYNYSGDEQLFDPLADILRSLSYVVEYVYNAFTHEIDNIPQEGDRRRAGEHFFQFLNDYATTIYPINNNLLSNIDTARYNNVNQCLSIAEEYLNRLISVVRGLRQEGNMNRAVNAIQPPPRLERRPSFEQINGGKRKKKRKSKKNIKRKKTRKNRKK